MATDNSDFLIKLLATFRIEADEHIEAMSAGLVELEKMPAGQMWPECVERVYREAHSLKGAARAVNLAEMETVCHALESVFAELKSNRIFATRGLFDLLHQALEALRRLLSVADQTKAGTQMHVVAALVRGLEDALMGAAPATPAVTVAPDASPGPGAVLPDFGRGAGTIRVHTAKLDSVMRQTEELLAPRLAAGERARELRELGILLATWKKAFTAVRPVIRTLERSFGQTGKARGVAGNQQELTKLLEYLDAEFPLMKQFEDGLTKLARSVAHDHRALSAMVDNLLQDVKEMHMLPFSSLLEVFSRLARELARDQGKQVELVIRGDEIEIDRRILEQIKDPLNHLFRNCVDHGVEQPALREHNGKPACATITIAVAHKDGSKIEILVADDGAGIDVAKVKVAAAKLGMMSAEELERLDERETLALVFRSGISTSPIITDLSGRGLGLAIVREGVERLGGTITLETQPGSGTTFRIVLPVTLATFRGVLVRVGDRTFIIPAVSVERVIRVAAVDIRTVENRETIPTDGRALSLVSLADVLEIPRAADRATDDAQVVVLGFGVDRIAFRVDAILAEQEVLVKGLGRQLKRVRNLAGASVLGTGQVVPVLDVSDLMQSAMRRASSPVRDAGGQFSPVEKRSILVAEDSITSRALIKNILESAGYVVTTAVDGVDAYSALKTGAFDLIVSDVEMPRMDGFDLTARVRADERLADLPVVLVTALDSREHCERGIDVGADAYIVKSSFDQSNLLEVIRRLL